MAVLVKHRRVCAGIIAASTVAFLVYAILLPNKYTASASLLPSGPTSGPLGLIAGFLPSTLEQLATSSGISSLLFPEILKSRQVVLATVDAPFDSVLQRKTGASSMRSLFLWRSNDKAYKGFLGKAKVTYSIEKGIVTLSFTSKDPYLSYFAVKTWLEKLEWFLQHNMQTQARKEYEYLTVRLRECLNQLDAAQESLRVFVRTHKNYSTDPVANMEYERLRVILDARKDAYRYIVQQLESARLNMVKSVPSVNVLDPPEVPRTKTGPRRSFVLAAGVALGCILAAAYVTLAERWDAIRSVFLRRK